MSFIHLYPPFFLFANKKATSWLLHVYLYNIIFLMSNHKLLQIELFPLLRYHFVLYKINSYQYITTFSPVSSSSYSPFGKPFGAFSSILKKFSILPLFSPFKSL